MTRSSETDRRLRVLILVICAIALLMVVATALVAWQTHESDERIENSTSGMGLSVSR
jgi:hypothetical protein